MSLTKITKEVLVQASQTTAFEVFTQKIDLWWPKTHHIGKSPLQVTVLEQKTNGRWYTVHEDGSKENVGYVINWDPHAQLMLAWQINGNYQFDPALVTEVEVNFIPEGPKQTRVTFEHRNLQKLAGGAKVIEGMDGGWGMILNLYKQAADKASS